MGTEITLAVGGIDLTYSKNSMGVDHGALFQDCDRKRIHGEQIDYDYFRETGEDPADMEMAFSRSLADVVPRLELLGFTLDQVEREYNHRVAEWRDEVLVSEYQDHSVVENLMEFQAFVDFARKYPIGTLDETFVAGVDHDSEIIRRGRFIDESEKKRLPYYSNHNRNAYSERTYFGELIGILHPYSVLRFLAECPENLSLDVTWHYGPLVTGGYISEAHFVPNARRTETFLVATEGSSDVHILQHALALLRPNIADFFRFMDVSERHPFSGTGSLLKFAEGLAKIDVHNQVVFLFDNDAEGFEAHQKLSSFAMSSNMRGMLLPEVEEFRRFPARGPTGISEADINRQAAAIECYLDLERPGCPPALVQWTSFKRDIDAWQGALEHKESYMRRFLDQTAETVGVSYNVKNVACVLDALFLECCTVAVGKQTLSYDLELG